MFSLFVIEITLFMGKHQIQRKLFFWIDKLQITKRERVTITALLSTIVVLLLLDVVIQERVVPAPENHAEIIAEFERRSALIEREKLIQDQIYAGIDPAESVETEDKNLEPISINRATIVELTSLPGIGETYAQRIIEYRETNGDFTSVENLVNVRGIGERTLEKLKPYIKL
jgi:comEA protein